MAGTLYAYELSPIDHWGGWRRPEDVYRVSSAAEGAVPWPGEHLDARGWPDLWARAQRVARKTGYGWEGDIREGPFLTVLPPGEYGEPLVVIAFKQDNNGMTYVVSPVPLPWLGKPSAVADA